MFSIVIITLISILCYTIYSPYTYVNIPTDDGSRTAETCFVKKMLFLFLKSYRFCYYWGSRVGAVVKALASHQCGPGLIPGLDVVCGLRLLLVLYSAPRGFSPETPVFPSPQKPTFPNSNLIWMQDLPESFYAVSGAS